MMILNRLLRKLKANNTCWLCSKPIEVISETEISDQHQIPTVERSTIKIKKKKIKKHVLELEKFFDNINLLPYKTMVPEKLLYYTPYLKPDYMYLICPDVAKKVANYILPSLNMNRNQVVAETNPGFGFIAKELIKKGVPFVRLYENNTDFQRILKNMCEEERKHFHIFNKDFFKLQLYSHVDKFDQGPRVTSLLEGVPKKSWTDDPVMTVIGTLTNLFFIKYLIQSIVLQRDVATYGRIDIFALMFPKDWASLTSTKKDNLYYYKSSTILFQIFFEAKLLDKFPRKLFLPWQAERKTRRNALGVDPDNIYLIKISMRKDFCLNAEEFVPFFCFIRTFLSSANKFIIPTCEKWVPDCGLNLILPTLKHEDYFEDLNIYTKFRELDPKQIVAVFKEISSLPGYYTSPFMDMVEQEMIKSETINSDLHSALSR